MSKSKRKNMLEALAISMNREAIPELIAWIRDLNRKEAIHAFTEGPVRDVAYAIEYALRMERETAPALPRPPTLRATERCQRCGFVQYIREEFDAYAAACIAENASTNSWQPIETAPKDDTRVDLWRPWTRSDGTVYGGERCTNMRRIELAPDNIFYSPDYSGPSCVRDATHWMPIPGPPK